MLPAIPEPVIAFCSDHGRGGIRADERVSGGNINQARRLQTASGARFILKQSSADAPVRLFECEADGLRILREAGMRTPEVYAVGEHYLLMEDLGEQTSEPDWETFGRAVARQHQHTGDRFGFAYDNFLGPLPQINSWSEDGHAFFGQRRVLRYLTEPMCAQVMTPDDRHGLERLVKRLPELVPTQPPSLLHGDLWHTNMLADSHGQPSLIDPAVYYGWPEAELSMTRQYGRVPPLFFDAYLEVNPLAAGWWERLELLMIRQHMAVLAFFGNKYNSLADVRAVIKKFG